VANFLKSRTGRVLAIILLLFGLYTLAGFFLAPHLVRNLLVENIQKTLGAAPEVGEIHVNPLTLKLDVRNFSLPSSGGKKLLGFEHFSVNVSPASLWRRAFVFGDIVLEAPFVNTVVAADGSVNLMQLRPKNAPAAAPPPDKTQQPLPRVQIGLFRVSNGTVSYEDESRSPTFATRLAPIEFDLRDFSTGIEGGLFDFSGKTRNDERIEWHGHLSVPDLESDGQIKLTGLQAKTIWEYIESRVNFAISSGKINVDANYRVSVKENTELHVELRQFDVSALGIRARAGDADWISVPDLRVGATSLDLAQHEVKIDSVVFKGLQVTAWLNADKSLNLLSLAGAPGAAAKPGPKTVSVASTTPTAAPATGAGNSGWRVELRDFALQDATVSFEDRSTKPIAKFALAPVALDLQGASLDLSHPVQVKLDVGINAAGHLGLIGAVTPAPLAADLAVQLAKFDLTALQPYIGQLTAMSLLSGQLGADIKIKYGAAKPILAVKGAVSVTGLHTIDNTLQDDFINWDSLDIKNFSYQQQPARLEIDRVIARKLYSRTIIETDSTLNVERVLGTAKPAAGKASPAAKQAAPAAASTVAPAPAAAPVRAPSMYMAIHKVEVSDGTMNFSDFSINPNFSAGIQKLNGSVSGLSSRPDSRATVDLKGEVDEFSPVSIAGDVNLLSPALYSDVTMSFRNIELSIINPYSGKFAGYNITKGKLTTELHYKLEGRKLDAQHHITIDQLEFGDRTASKDAVSLPIKLAVALLKDRNGVINLDVPVSGSLDDPKFSIMPIIGKVLMNILEKLVTAPFAMLGALFSAGPDLQFVDFQPGSAALDAAASARLKSIAKALTERPQLKLDVPIAVVADIDRPALAEVKFQSQLQAAQKAKPGASASRLSLLHILYVSTVGGEPKYPDDAKTDAQRADFLAGEVRKRIAVTDTELVDLGQQRALALQSALLTDTQLEPERVFLVQSDKAKLEGDVVRLEMTLR
jgi:hypothetical protein